MVIYYNNQSSTDAPAPLIFLYSDTASFQGPGDTGFSQNGLLVLGVNHHGPAGTLPGGASDSINVNVKETATSTIFVAVLDPTIDDSDELTSLPPLPGFSQSAWQATLRNFISQVGSTYGSLEVALDNAANYLSQLGETTANLDTLLGFVMAQAGDFGAIAQRQTQSAFGVGNQDPGMTAVAEASGNVTILTGATARVFTKQTDGSYTAIPGDDGVLTLSGGVFTLREASGNTEVFNADGTLNILEDAQGNKLLYGYTNGLLTSLTSSTTGGATTFTYNAQNLISQITDPVGRVSTLTYDDGNRLTSVTTPQGTTSYNYVTTPGSASENAIASITTPDGSQVLFSYDGQGRLSTQTQAGGAVPVSFSYDQGAITETDADGNAATFYLNSALRVAKETDPLGRSVSATFDNALDDPLNYTGPDGNTASIGYDDNDNPVLAVDPLGQQTSATFGATPPSLQSLTDAEGNTVNVTNDSSGNPSAIAFPDGSVKRFSFDAVGNVTEVVNRAGPGREPQLQRPGTRDRRSVPGRQLGDFHLRRSPEPHVDDRLHRNHDVHL